MSADILYFTDNTLPPAIAARAQSQLATVAREQGLRIICSSLRPMDFGDVRLVFADLRRGILTMFKQVLWALEAASADTVFLCEHDVLYSLEHFDFAPPTRDAYYYNTNVWKVWMADRVATRMDGCMQVSGLAGDRELLLGHYRRRVAKLLANLAAGVNLDRDGYSKHMGFEPGGHMAPRGVDSYPRVGWESSCPIVDLRHGGNFTRGRRRPEEFHEPETVKGWVEADEIPGWGKVAALLEGLS